MGINKTKSSLDKVFCGIDFHKKTSTLCALYEDGREAEPLTTIDSSKLCAYLSNRKNYKIGIEVTGGVNHVVQKLKDQGHEVVLINPNQFRGIGIGGKKTDDRDARALAQALRLGFVPQVHHRSPKARELKSLLTTREHVVRSRVDSINHIRGTLREYGILMPAGAETFYEQASGKIEEVPNGAIKCSLQGLLENIKQYLSQEKAIEQSLKIVAGEDAHLARLQSIPGIGFITSVTMLSVVDEISRFRTAKEFAAYLGLVPSVHASASKCMMGSITRSGSEMLRRYLIHGARAWMRYSPEKSRDSNRVWAEKVKERRGANKATVALAHRLARISFAVLRDGVSYKQFKKRAPVVQEDLKVA